MHYIFLDTNIFLHFIEFEQINWNEVLNENNEIIIAFAPIVIDELDKHKYNKNQKISGRIKKLLPKIEDLIEGHVSSKYGIRHVDRRPNEATFSEYSLDRSEQD